MLTLKEPLDPPHAGAAHEAGLTIRTATGATCVTVTSRGLPEAPGAVTVITPVREVVSVEFAEKPAVIEPLFPPEAPPVMLNHVELLVTAAV